jgi:hypothetical protein
MDGSESRMMIRGRDRKGDDGIGRMMGRRGIERIMGRRGMSGSGRDDGKERDEWE